METVNFTGAKRGQTIPAIAFTVAIDTVPATNIAKVEMELRRDGNRAKRYSSETGEISVSGATVTILAHTLTIPAYAYAYDLLVTLDDGVTFYPFGGTFTLADRETITA